MPSFDYSRFDKIDVSDSDDEGKDQAQAQDKAADEAILADLPPELSPELSLVLAARHGQQHVVEALLRKRASVNAADPHGATALLRAVEGGIENRKVIEILLNSRASVDQLSEGGQTALGRAASVGTVEVCQALVEACTPSDITRATALAAAAVAGNSATSEFLLGMKASPCTASDSKLPLNSWAKHGNRRLMELLVQRRADILACDSQGTPLTCAVQAGSTVDVQWLCNQRADINAVTDKGRTALVEAVDYKDTAVAGNLVSTLLELRADVEATVRGASRSSSPLVAAACAGRPAIGKLLLGARVDVNAADFVGCRALPCAALIGNADFCRMLLENGARVDERGTSGGTVPSATTSGVTALSVAVAAGDVSLAKLFLESQADTELADERDFLPLMTAARLGNKAMCALLLDSRAQVDSRQTDTEKTSLVLAAGVGSVDVCEALIAARADVEARASTQVTALHAAAANGHEAVCRRLVASGASLHALGPGGQNAAAMATAAGHTSLAEVLSAL